MIAPAQRTLPNFRLHEHTKLVTVEGARAALNVDAQTVRDMIDSGEIAWAFNIALGERIREERILVECFGGRPFETLDQVLDHLCPLVRRSIRAVEVEKLLVCSRPLILDLHRAGELQGIVNGHTRHIEMASLREFLKRRRIV